MLFTSQYLLQINNLSINIFAPTAPLVFRMMGLSVTCADRYHPQAVSHLARPHANPSIREYTSV